MNSICTAKKCVSVHEEDKKDLVTRHSWCSFKRQLMDAEEKFRLGPKRIKGSNQVLLSLPDSTFQLGAKWLSWYIWQ